MAVEGFRERKFRSALNIIGILIGCTAITGLISITQGLGDEISEQLEIFGPNNIMVVPGRIQPGRGLVGETLSWRDIEIISKIPHVELATPIIGNKVCQLNVRGKSYYSSVFGVSAEYFTIFKNYKLADGRTLSRADNAVAVLGALVAHPMDSEEPIFDVGDRIKMQVNVHGEDKEMVFRVIGIMKEIGGTFGAEDDNSITIPLRVCQQLYDVGGEFDYIAALVDSTDRVDEAVKRIEDTMGDDVMVMSYETVQGLVGDVLGTIEAVLGGIAAISLIVAGVGIINTMTISVMERTREIGILKAIGAKSREVLILVLSEAIFTGLFGGIIGAILGFVLGQKVGDYINLPVSFSFDLGVGVTVFAIITCVVSGLYPAWRAANLNPVDALRHE